MIIAYKLKNLKGKLSLEKVEVEEDESIPAGTVWLDLIEPTVDEEKQINRLLKIDAPTREEVDKIELMSPFYKEDNAHFMTVTAIHRIDKEYPDGTPVIFILHPKCLVTIRYVKLRSFVSFSTRAMRNPSLCVSPEIILEGLVESFVNSLADGLEKTGGEIDQLLVDVFEKPKNLSESDDEKDDDKQEYKISDYYSVLIRRVGQTGNLVSKIRES